MSEGPQQAEALSNGPIESQQINGADDGTDKIWQKPWSTNQMRNASNNWSLAGDAGLLNFLQQFSQRMISRTTEVEKQLDDLVHEAKSTNTRVQNVINDFLMLSNTQFIENRVYEDDIEVREDNGELEKKPAPEKDESEMLPRVEQALRLGLAVLNTKFNRLDVGQAGQSDSDEEDDDGSPASRYDPILEPKDRYVHRPLPHLIGSAAFHEDDDVGLTEFSEDEDDEEEDTDDEMEENIADKSELSSEYSSDVSSEYSEDSEVSSDAQGSRKRTGTGDTAATINSEKSGDGLFDEESVMVGEEDKQPLPALDFNAELAAKLGGAAPEETKQREETGKSRTGSTRSEKKQKKKKRSDSKREHEEKRKQEDDLFGAAPQEEDEDSPFGKSGGLFSGGGGLFDDFGDGGAPDDLFASAAQAEGEEKVEKSEVAEAEEKKEVLIEPKARARTRSGKKLPTGAVSLFGDNAEDLFSPKRPSGSIDEADEDDLFATKISKKEKLPKSTATKKQDKKIKPKSEPAKGDAKQKVGSSLFSDDQDEDDDGLFSAPPNKAKTKEGKTEKMKPKTFDKLFGDDEEGEDDLFAITAKPKRKKTKSISVFDDSPATSPERGGAKPIADLTSGSSGLFGDSPNTSPERAAATATSTVSAKPTKISLFDDDDDNIEDGELFGAPKTKKMQAKSGSGLKSSIFDDDSDADQEDDVDLFGKKSPLTNTDTPTVKKPVGGVSMFGGLNPTALLLKKPGGDKPADPETSPEETAAKNVQSTTEKKSAIKQPPGKPTSKPASEQSSTRANQQGSKLPNTTQQAAPDRPTRKPTTESIAKSESNTETPTTGLSGFDQPADVTNILHSVAKGRAKLAPKRRPPSRNRATPSSDEIFKPRIFAADASPASTADSHDVDKLDGTSTGVDSSNDIFAATSKKKEKQMEKSEDAGDDIFAAMTKKKETEKVKFEGASDDIFSITSQKEKKQMAKSEDVGDDLFAATTKKKEILDSDNISTAQLSTAATQKSAKSTSKKQREIVDIFNDDVTDDIFGSKKTETAKKRDFPVKSPSLNRKFGKDGAKKLGDIFADSPDDDIFGATASKKKDNKKVANDEDIFGTTTSKKKDSKKVANDEDIFGTTTSKKKDSKKVANDDDIFGTTTSKKNDSKKVANDDDIFGTTTSKKKDSKKVANDDDIFGTTTSKKKDSEKVANDDNIFGTTTSKKKESEKVANDDDIFGTAANEKKASKNVTFDDDIFATAKSEKTSSKKAPIDDIFSPDPKETSDIVSKPAGEGGDLRKHDNNDKDVLGATSSQPAESKQTQAFDDDNAKKKREKEKVMDDIFKDDTDIFSDLPTKKMPAAKKKSKATTAKSIFPGDGIDDDIFAVKSNKSTAKKPRKTKKKEVGDKDGASIFHDPLSAMDK